MTKPCRIVKTAAKEWGIVDQTGRTVGTIKHSLDAPIDTVNDPYADMGLIIAIGAALVAAIVALIALGAL